MAASMATPKKPTKAELAKLIGERVKRAVTTKGASVSLDLGKLDAPRPINGGARQLLPRNGTARARGNIDHQD